MFDSSIKFSGTLFAFISCFAKNSLFPPSIISVPRPAMFVAIVTAPNLPAWAIISASCSWYLAFNTVCLIPASFNFWLNNSDFSTDTVPINIGCPFAWASFTLSTIALNLALSFLYITSFKSFLITGLFVGIATTSKL